MQPPNVGADLQVGPARPVGPEPMLDVQDVQTYYGESHVLRGVTLSARKGAVTAVLGRNGVGKTTLCRSLAGLTPARSGRVVLNGTDITRLPPHRIHHLGVSLVPQGRRIFTSLSVRENLQIAEARTPPAAASSSAEPSTAHGWDLDRVFSVFPRLAERREHRGNQLSGGEQQMLAIARALVAQPLLLIMDEPTEGLAPVIVAEVASVIRRLKEEGASILLVEQNAAFAIKVADYVHVMSKGQVVHSTDPLALWNNEEIKTQFLGVPPAPRARRDL
jgi:branched-chain amino acid transport system ATP-binding protein